MWRQGVTKPSLTTDVSAMQAHETAFKHALFDRTDSGELDLGDLHQCYSIQQCIHCSMLQSSRWQYLCLQEVVYTNCSQKISVHYVKDGSGDNDTDADLLCCAVLWL